MYFPVGASQPYEAVLTGPEQYPFADGWSLVTIKPKYVNMPDIIVTERPTSPDPESTTPAGEPAWDVIELLFFAYRDFVGDPDGVLAHFGFGRAHHRVLHFVNRHPGMKVADCALPNNPSGACSSSSLTKVMWCRRKAPATAASGCSMSHPRATRWP